MSGARKIPQLVSAARPGGSPNLVCRAKPRQCPGRRRPGRRRPGRQGNRVNAQVQPRTPQTSRTNQRPLREARAPSAKTREFVGFVPFVANFIDLRPRPFGHSSLTRLPCPGRWPPLRTHAAILTMAHGLWLRLSHRHLVEWAASRNEDRAFANPVKAATLRWTS